jgi:hypothetical protein
MIMFLKNTWKDPLLCGAFPEVFVERSDRTAVVEYGEYKNDLACSFPRRVSLGA